MAKKRRPPRLCSGDTKKRFCGLTQGVTVHALHAKGYLLMSLPNSAELCKYLALWRGVVSVRGNSVDMASPARMWR